MSREPDLFDWRLARLWAIATTAGVFVGGFLGVYAGFWAAAAVRSGLQGESSDNVPLVAVVVGFAVAAAITGWMQQCVLQRRLAWPGLWVLLTTLGVVLAAVFSHLIGTFYSTLGSIGGLTGLGVGVAQWFLLKRQSKYAIAWIPVNAIAGGLGLSLLNGAAPLGPVAYALITAGAIAWLLSPRNSTPD